MSRYTGPRVRAMRALGVQLPGLSSKAIERRPFPPGQHGQARRKLSEYGLRLIEKQKLCRNYGVTEGQLRRLMIAARSAKGPTGERLLELLESRLDNVVFRMGFAVTRAQARQLVAHKAVLVNGKKVNIPSYQVRPGDAIALTEKARSQLRVQEAATVFDTMDLRPVWVEVDSKKFEGTFKSVPDRGDLPSDINEALIIELYSK